ncbi:MAG: hypothetical protein WB586_04740 [Chthoniobacterales bacterium]
MKTQPISFLSGLILAIAVPVILNAASLSWNPIKIAKDNGIVVLLAVVMATKPSIPIKGQRLSKASPGGASAKLVNIIARGEAPRDV